ncbi:MAG TPA: chloride channel protein [Rhizomicrobium sp.]|jgi:H+/Cl- antiporter ClcA
MAMAGLFNLRQLRRWRVHSRRWRRRAIFMLGGLATGAAAVMLTLGADGVQHLFREYLKLFPYGAFVATPLGFAAAVWLVQRVFPNTQGSGIPQAMVARALENPADRIPYVGPRVAVGKILLTLLGLLVGASAGREGPTVQVGASVMAWIGGFSPRRQPGLILAGAAAGVAAAFNTPLAGIVFGIEEMSRSFEVRTSGLIIGAVILAGLIAQALLGDYTYFGTANTSLGFGLDWVAVPVCGVLGGFLGGVFGRILVAFADGMPGRIGAEIARHPALFAALCGLAVAACGYASGGATFGTGYLNARGALHGTQALPADFMPLKFLATVITAISGIPGGIFAPSLSIGAGLGSEIARFLPAAPTGAIVLLGMVSYFTGVVRAPITAFVIVSEMAGNHAMLVPLMTAALIAEACSRLINRDGVYHALAMRIYDRRNATPPSRVERA